MILRKEGGKSTVAALLAGQETGGKGLLAHTSNKGTLVKDWSGRWKKVVVSNGKRKQF